MPDGFKRISKRSADAVLPGTRDVYLWDRDLAGFGLKVTPSGRKVYLIQYRLGGRKGRTRRVTIGVHGTITAEEARGQARRLLGEVAAKRDPAEERRRPDGLSLAAALERFFAGHVRPKRKRRTAEEYESLARLHIVPQLGRRRLETIDRPTIAHLHGAMADRPYSANRVLALLSKFFNWCEQQGLRPDQTNPCRHVEKYPERKRERFLSAEELARLGGVLARHEAEGRTSPHIIAAIRLLVLTGARLSEILTLQWEHVDTAHGLARLPDSKTGAKTIYFGASALDVLGRVPRLAGNPYVICGARAGRRLVNLEKPWRRIRAEAAIEDVRLHDLRHSFASVAAASGISLPIIGALLGHSQPQTTARYVHLGADPLRQANASIGAAIEGWLSGPASSSETSP